MWCFELGISIWYIHQIINLYTIKPVSLGISGPGMSERQAFARIRPVSERAVEAVFSTAKELKRIK